MKGLTIEARSQESARGLYNAVAPFYPELVEGDGGRYQVTVEPKSEQQIAAILNALQTHVAQRDSRPARVELDGRSYTLHPV